MIQFYLTSTTSFYTLLPMSKIDKQRLKTLQKLCRIRLEEHEEDQLLKNLEKVLNFVEMLKEVNTQGIEPCTHIIHGMKAPLREDEPKRLIPREEFLRAAPDQIGGMIKVPKVMKDEL